MKSDMQQSIRNPEQVFAEPADVEQCKSLTDKEKIHILQNWHADLMEIQKANEENMLRADAKDEIAAERLANVAAALARMEESCGPKDQK